MNTLEVLLSEYDDEIRLARSVAAAAGVGWTEPKHITMKDGYGDSIEVLTGGAHNGLGGCIRTDAAGVALTSEQTLSLAKTLWPAASRDAEALDEIAHMLRDPEYATGMLEDIATIVERSGRDTDTQYEDGEAVSTWERH